MNLSCKRMVTGGAVLLVLIAALFCAGVYVGQAKAESTAKTSVTLALSNTPNHSVCIIGENYTPTFTAKTPYSKDVIDEVTVKMSSSDESIMSVDGAALVPQSIGEATVTFTFDDTDEYTLSRPLTQTFFVSAGKIDVSTYDAYVVSEPTETGNGTCRVFSANESALANGALAIPEQLTQDDKTYDVVGKLGEDNNPLCSSSLLSCVSSLSVPSGVTAIASQAFINFSKLKSISFAESGQLETIGGWAFSGCSSLESLAVPASVKTIENGAFRGCSSLTSLKIAAGGELVCSNTFSGSLPWYSPFGTCTSLSDVSLGEGVKSISGAFNGCSKLESISIPASVENIEYAFCSCSKLSNISFASNSKLVKAGNAFNGCTSLTSADASSLSALTSMDGMFYGCSSLTSLVVPDCANLSMAIAEDCPKLASVTVPAGAQNLTQTAQGAILAADASRMIYYPASAAEDCVLPQDCVTVSDFAFQNNTKLKSVTFTSSSAQGSIGVGAFKSCTALSSVKFAGGAFGSIGKEAFAYCAALKSIDIPGLTAQSVLTDYYTDRGTDKVYSSGYIVSLDSPCDTVETSAIGAFAFKGCTALEEVRFGSASELGCYALVDEGSDIFCACTSLKNLVFDGKQPYWMNDDASVGKRSQASGFYTYARYIDYFLEKGNGDTESDSHSGMKRPDFSYAVDYYLTKDVAQSDDGLKSKRLARIEYKRGTDTSAVATGSKDALKDSVYQENDAAKIPDPNAVAKENGMSGTDWVWAFEDHCGDYGDLYDSCYVYLAHANDLSLGYVESAPTSAMREPIVSNLSSSFDIERWYGANKYNEPYATCSSAGYKFDAFKYSSTFSEKAYNEDSVRKRFEGTCYFTWGAKGFIEELDLKAADGAKLVEGTDYTVTYQKPNYDSATGKVSFTTVTKCIEQGPYLMTFTALAGGKCTAGTSYEQWVLVKPHSSTVSLYDQRTNSETGVAGTFSTAVTPYAAMHEDRDHRPLGYGTAYTVTVAENDTLSALFATEIAGLNQARMDYSSTDLDGFTVKVGNSTKKWTSSGLTAVEMANWVYSNLNEKKTQYGFKSSANPWGDTAFLCSAAETNVLNALATNVYQMKAPVFLTSQTGQIDEETLTNLKDFKNVVVFGDEGLVSEAVVDQVVDACGINVTRVPYASGDVCGLSLAAADYAIATGVDASVCVICDAQDRLETIGATDYVGFVGGVTLSAASTVDAKRVVGWMYANRDVVSKVRIFGREDGVFADCDIASMIMPNGWVGKDDIGHWDGTDSIWSDDIASTIAERVAVAAGDTVANNGMVLTLQKDGSFAYGGTNYYGAETLAKGQELSYLVPKVDEKAATAEEVSVKGTLTTVPDGYLADAMLQFATGSADMQVGDSVDLSYVYAGDAALGAESSDENIVKVSMKDGKLVLRATGIGEGTVKLSAPASKAYKAASASMAVYVSKGSLENASVDAIPAQTYTSKAIKPAIKVILNGEGLVLGKDYTLSYANNINAGTAKVTLAGTGGYAGSKEISFTINKAAQSIKAKSTSKVKTLKAAKKGKFKKKLKSNVSISASAFKKLYGLSASGTLSFARASITAKAKKFVSVSSAGKVTIKKGLKKGTYSLKVKAQAAKTANYNAAQAKTLTLKIKVK